MNIKFLISVLATFFTSIALAEPTYISCKVSSANEQKSFSVKIDEGSGKITHTRENGGAFNADGFFSSNTISYQQINIVSEMKIIYKYEIDRTTLSVKEQFLATALDPEIAAKIPAETTEMLGTCNVVKTENRKI